MKDESGGVKKVTRQGVKVEGGYLIGTDHGEWGGSIEFIDSLGVSHQISRVPTQEIYAIGKDIFAVTDQGQFNRGSIYRITKASSGEWAVADWRQLPGSPIFSRLLKDGNLFVSCYNGMVLVSPNGTMKSLTRAEAL